MTEFDQKQARLRALLDERHLDALLLRRVSSVAWATCGARAYVNIASNDASASLLITRSARYLITSNLEAARFQEEEHLTEQGWEFRVAPWYQDLDEVANLTRGMRVGADRAYPSAVDLSRDLVRMRTNLTPEEGERFRILGRLCEQAVQVTARTLQPGQTEQAISARLGYDAEVRGTQAITNIVATDWRVGAFRHALPTEKPLERYAMLVLNGRRWGLVCTVTRFVHFGALPADLRTHHETAAQIAAQCIDATRPGESLSDLFQFALSAYAHAGFPEEWRKHHQGGVLGYEPRELLITSNSRETVSIGQACVWNPSIGSARSVDTFLVGRSENEILTASESWPSIAVNIQNRVYNRPAVLEVG